MLVIVGSTNPVKTEAARRGFLRMFPDESTTIHSLAVRSGIAAQPMTDEETKLGSINRAKAAREAQPEADFWIGLEGGVQTSPEGMLSFGWVCVLSKEKQGLGRAGTFLLPKRIADLIKAGLELGQADDQVFSRQGSNKEEGAIGIMTHGAINRVDAFEMAVVLALIPFRNPELY